jgi:hypothetical protein
LAAIRRWQPKIKPGGLLCGHDYAEWFPRVVEAVHETLIRLHRVFADSSWLFRL